MSSFKVETPKFAVGGMCFETYPCQHHLTFQDTGKTVMMGGRAIVKLYQDSNLKVPDHFHYLLEKK